MLLDRFSVEWKRRKAHYRFSVERARVCATRRRRLCSESIVSDHLGDVIVREGVAAASSLRSHGHTWNLFHCEVVCMICRCKGGTLPHVDWGPVADASQRTVAAKAGWGAASKRLSVMFASAALRGLCTRSTRGAYLIHGVHRNRASHQIG